MAKQFIGNQQIVGKQKYEHYIRFAINGLSFTLFLRLVLNHNTPLTTSTLIETLHDYYGKTAIICPSNYNTDLVNNNTLWFITDFDTDNYNCRARYITNGNMSDYTDVLNYVDDNITTL